MKQNNNNNKDFNSLYSRALKEWPQKIEFGHLRNFDKKNGYIVEGLFETYSEKETLYLGDPEEVLMRNLHDAIYCILYDTATYCSTINLDQLRKETVKSKFESLLDSSYIENYSDEDKALVKQYFDQTLKTQEKFFNDISWAARGGSEEDQFRIGEKYYWGEGIERNYREAIKWYTMAAERGHKKSQYKLATMYERGDGVYPNYEEAHFWYGISGDWDDEIARRHLTEQQINAIKNRVKVWTIKE